MKTITVESQQQTVEVEFVLTFEDLAEVQRLRRRRIRRRQGRHLHLRVVVISVIVLLGAGGGLMALATQRDPYLLAAAVLAMLAVVVAAAGAWWFVRQERRALAALANQQPVKQRWVASPAGLRKSQGGLVTDIPWSAMRRMQRLGKAVVLIVDELHVHVIPDRAFVTERQQLRFLRMVKANLEHHRR